MNQTTTTTTTQGKSRKGKMIDQHPVKSTLKIRSTEKLDNKANEKIQATPTPEQLRIAHIIDMKTEDPSLKDKLKQVMDATQRSADEAYTALHDSDNDLNRAVNLLLEGGMKDEWSTSSKKKKVRPTNEKPKDVQQPVQPQTNDSPPNQVEEEDWDNIMLPAFHKDMRGGRGGGRPFKAGRGRGFNNQINHIDSNEKSRRGRNSQTNGPVNGKTGRSFRGGRQGPRGRGRGGSFMFRRPIDAWNNDTIMTNDLNNSSQGQSVVIEDWDSEEYTGSLANSQVFTPSAPAEPKTDDINSLLHMENSTDRISPPIETVSHSITTSHILSHFAMQQQLKLENKSLNRDSDVSINEISATSVPPPGIGITKSDAFTVTRGRGTLLNFSRPDDNRLPRIPAKAKPRLPPPSKIPLTAVEMPPEVDSAIGRLDVQFGALDFGESSSDTLPATPPSPQRSSPSPPPSDGFVPQNLKLLLQSGQGNESLISNDSRSFSPVPGSASNSLTPQLSEVGSTKIPETSSSSLYQDTVYQSSLYTKSPQQSQGIYNSTYTTGQGFTSNSAIYSSSTTTHSSYSNTVGNYGNNSYPPYQYPNYASSHQPSTQSNSSNSYQSSGSNQYGIGNQSVYGNSSLNTSSYSIPYQSYNSSNQHKVMPSAPSSKEFESPTPTVNLSSISHTGSISGGSSTLLSSTQTTQPSKTTGSTTMSKGTMVTNMPPGVQQLVGTHQYIMGQGGMPYFQQHPVYYDDLQMLQQQRLPHIPGYFEVGYQPSTTREYNLSDGRFARADNTSPVQVSSITPQSGSQAHQQQLLNPTALPPAYAYFYGGSVIPGNFQFGTPIYPVAPTGSTSGHGSTSSGTYGKGPTTYAGSYTGIYDSTQQNVGDYKSSSSQGPKVQPTQSAIPSTSSDISNIYSKSHSALSKSFDKPGFHCATPPPFNLGSQNSGIGPGGYPQHLFIPTMTPHHNTTLMHQPLHQESGNSVSGRSQVSNQQNKGSKTNYTASTYWTPN